MRRLSLLVCLMSLLAACQLSGPGKPGGRVGPNAVTGSEIEVTALDALPGEPTGAAKTPAAEAGGNDRAAPQGAAPGAKAEADPEVPAAAEAVKAEPAPKAELEEEPGPPKSELQLACEKKRGIWSGVGKGDLRACVFQTRDGNKQCKKESDCEGVCLARSGTCSPFKPLFGCNDILQDDGARVTLCIE